MNDTSGPAFPSHGSMGEVAHQGMTLLQWYTGMALQGILAGYAGTFTKASIETNMNVAQLVAQCACEYANAVIKEQPK
jgi:hypothetical protein